MQNRWMVISALLLMTLLSAVLMRGIIVSGGTDQIVAAEVIPVRGKGSTPSSGAAVVGGDGANNAGSEGSSSGAGSTGGSSSKEGGWGKGGGAAQKADGEEGQTTFYSSPDSEGTAEKEEDGIEHGHEAGVLIPGVHKAAPMVRLSDEVPKCTVVNHRGMDVCAPSYVIVGQRKCGSTSLYAVLIQHPDVKSAAKKEVNYFGMRYIRSNGNMQDYFDFFPALDKNVTTGESSPQYMNGHPLVAEQLAKELPNAKLIFSLRDPVERAWSDWKMGIRQGWMKKGFTELTRKEAKINAGCKDKADWAEKKMCYKKLGAAGLLAMGQYAEILKHWMNYFPREQMLILRAEDYYDDSPAVMAEITEFLELREYDWETNVKNFHWNAAKNNEPLSDANRSFLREFFKPYNQELVELLGPNFSWGY